MSNSQFKVITVDSWVKVEIGRDGLGEEPYHLMISQPDTDGDRTPGDPDLIHMTISEAREFHRKLGEALSKVP